MNYLKAKVVALVESLPVEFLNAEFVRLLEVGEVIKHKPSVDLGDSLGDSFPQVYRRTL